MFSTEKFTKNLPAALKTNNLVIFFGGHIKIEQSSEKAVATSQFYVYLEVPQILPKSSQNTKVHLETPPPPIFAVFRIKKNSVKTSREEKIQKIII